MYQRKLEDDIRCPLEYGLRVFGGKWNSRVICVLEAKSPLRYSKLRHEMGNITDAVLAATLKELITNGVIARRSFDEVPPHVEYCLTERGKSVVPLLQGICRWAGLFYREEEGSSSVHCHRCDYNSEMAVKRENKSDATKA